LHSAIRALLVSLLLATALAQPRVAGSATGFPGTVLASLREEKIPTSAVSVYVQETTASVPALRLNDSVPRNPASVAKLLTTLGALDALGPAYTWRTEAYLSGDLRDGRLKGNLVIKGHGDPWLTTESFWIFLRGLRERGLRVIEGDLILDSSRFEVPPSKRAEFDGQPDRAYNAIPDALSVNFQALSIYIVPDPGGRKIRIYTDPPQHNLQIDNRLRVKPGKCAGKLSNLRIDHDPARGRLTLNGDYAAACGETTLQRLVQRSTDQISGAFQALWKELGGELRGKSLFHTLESRPLDEAIRGMNKYSNNLMARLIFLTLGAEELGEPGTVEKGGIAIQRWLAENQIDAPELVIDNGSGLSRETRVSAATLGRALVAGYRKPYMPELISSLPLAGIDGTMRRRLRSSELEGRAHLKTGSLDGVSSIAGYVHDSRSRHWVVVLMINQPGLEAWRAKKVQDVLLRYVYDQAERCGSDLCQGS